jgi:DNA invertase Pin-like site-specific DNA recombinase
LKRKAIVYIRKSSTDQVQTNRESRQRQYELVEKVRLLGFRDAAGQAASFAGTLLVLSELRDIHRRTHPFEKWVSFVSEYGTEGGGSYKPFAPPEQRLAVGLADAFFDVGG